MTLDYIKWEPVFNLHLTAEQIDIAHECSRVHYDTKCRSASGDYNPQLRNKAFLTAARNHKASAPNESIAFTWGELDTFCKILEGARFLQNAHRALTGLDLGAAISRLLREHTSIVSPNPLSL